MGHGLGLSRSLQGLALYWAEGCWDQHTAQPGTKAGPSTPKPGRGAVAAPWGCCFRAGWQQEGEPQPWVCLLVPCSGEEPQGGLAAAGGQGEGAPAQDSLWMGWRWQRVPLPCGGSQRRRGRGCSCLLGGGRLGKPQSSTQKMTAPGG